MKKIDPVTEKTQFQTQFEVWMTPTTHSSTPCPCNYWIVMNFFYHTYSIQVLQQVTPDLEGTKTFTAQKNEDKNRLAKYLPRKLKWSWWFWIALWCLNICYLHAADNHRVVLKQEESDYIHATFVNVSGHSQCLIINEYTGSGVCPTHPTSTEMDGLSDWMSYMGHSPRVWNWLLQSRGPWQCCELVVSSRRGHVIVCLHCLVSRGSYGLAAIHFALSLQWS